MIPSAVWTSLIHGNGPFLVGPELFWQFMQHKGFIRLSPITGRFAGRLVATMEMPERLGIVDAAFAELKQTLRPWMGLW